MLPFMIHDRETFDNITDLDRLIYLGGYNELLCEDGNVIKYNFSFVLTTKRLLIDVHKKMCANLEGLNTAFDGTFNLCVKY